jgi:hypothetical protein
MARSLTRYAGDRKAALVIRRRTVWLIALLVFVTLASVSVAVLSFAPEIVRRAAIVRLESLTRRRVSIDRVELSLLTGHVAFHGVRVAEQEGSGTLAKVTRIEGRVHRRSLWRLHVWIEDLAIAGTEIRVIRLSPTRFNISDLLERPAQPPGRTPVTIDRLRITDSALFFEDRTLSPTRTWGVERIDVEGRALSTTNAGGSLELQSVVAGAPLHLHVEDLRLAPIHLRAHVSAANVDLGLLRLYLPGDAAVLPERGVLAAGATVVYDAADGTLVSAGARVRDAVLHRRGQDGAFATSPEITITLNDLAVKGRDFSVARAEVEGDLALVEALYDPPLRYAFSNTRLVTEDLTWPSRRPGRVLFSGRLPGGASLDVHGTITSTPLRADLTARALRLPVDLANRYARLAGTLGGIADIDARVVASLENKRLQLGITGSAGATRLVVTDPTRPGQPPLGVERLDAGGIDYEWPARLAVGFLNLRNPWATVERDAAGTLTLPSLFARPAASGGSTPAERQPKPSADVSIGELRVQNGTLTLVDGAVTPVARVGVSAIGLSVKNAGWPARGPAQIALEATLPGGGTVTVAGNGELDQRVVRVKVSAKNLDVAQAQPYLPFRGRVQGRLAADLDVRGRLDPPRMRVRGTVGIADAVLIDGNRQLLTVARIDATGVDYRAPARISVDDLRVSQPWALVDRDERGQFSLRAALAGTRHATPAAGAAQDSASPPVEAAPSPEVVVRRVLFEDGGTNIVDDSVEPAARFQIRGTRLEVRNFTWPVKVPAEVVLATPTPRGGRVEGRGTFQVDPSRMDVRVTLAGVALSPAQPYLPIGARVTGSVDGEAQISARFDPFVLSIRGGAAVNELGVGDANRQLLTAGRARAEGVDVQWPGGVRVTRVEVEKPWVLFEREASGRFPLVDLLTPRARAAAPTPVAARDPGSREPTEPLRFSLGTLALTDGFGRFVDRATDPDFAEELSAVNVTMMGVGNTPTDKARTALRATLGPSAPLSISGELGTIGAPLGVDVLFTLGGYAAPRANAYLETLFGWTARQGRLTLAARYQIEGDELDATNDVGADGLDVRHSETRAKPPKWPIGLPLDTFVSLLKDSHGHVELSLPVHGRLSSPQFDLADAIWSALRGLAFKTVGLPFALIGKLRVSEDSRIESLSVNPVTFVSGAATPAPGMTEHLDHLATFLRDKPAIRLRLRPVLTLADVEPLKREALRERLQARAKDGGESALREQALRLFTRRFPKRAPPAALDDLLAALAADDRAPAAAEAALAERRVAAVRDALVAHGVDAGRLAAQTAPPAVEGEGTGRVEFEITP